AIVQGGQTKSLARLDPAVPASVPIGVPLATIGAFDVPQPQRIFRLDNSEAAKLDLTKDSNVTLRLIATVNSEFEGDQLLTKDYVVGGQVAQLPLLTRYTGTNRFGERDADQCVGVNPPYSC